VLVARASRAAMARTGSSNLVNLCLGWVVVTVFLPFPVSYSRMYRQRKAGYQAVAMRETHGMTHGSRARIGDRGRPVLEVAAAEDDSYPIARVSRPLADCIGDGGAVGGDPRGWSRSTHRW